MCPFVCLFPKTVKIAESLINKFAVGTHMTQESILLNDTIFNLKEYQKSSIKNRQIFERNFKRERAANKETIIFNN